MKYGLIGEHLPHSFSKEIHESFAPYPYELKELTPCEVEGFMREKDFAAINVTIPYKKTVIPFLREIDEHAKAIGAVNTVINRNGVLRGYNTDFYGMRRLLERTAGDLQGKAVAVLGTGGTSLTAQAVAKYMGAKEILTVSRSPAEGQITYEELKTRRDLQVLINTTPVGMFPHGEATPLPLDSFDRLEAVADAIYNPLRTVLVSEAIRRGIKAEGGLYMLVAQAVKAAELFTDASFDEALVDEVYHKILKEKENIVLTGMPGSGKSTVGRLLSQSLSRPLFDSDREIERKTGMAIPEIFAQKGEEGFRAIEEEVIAELSRNHTGAIIATGGGAVLRDANVNALKQTGRIYFIDRALEHLLPTPDRPLALTAEAIRQRYRERIDRYRSTCDFTIVSDEVPEHTAQAIGKDFFQ